MTDESRTKIDPLPAPAPTQTFGDPVRPGFGDEDEDAGEGHKGPLVDATRMPSDTRFPDHRSTPSNPPNPKSPPSSECGNTDKEPDAKSVRTPSGS